MRNKVTYFITNCNNIYFEKVCVGDTARNITITWCKNILEKALSLPITLKKFKICLNYRDDSKAPLKLPSYKRVK